MGGLGQAAKLCDSRRPHSPWHYPLDLCSAQPTSLYMATPAEPSASSLANHLTWTRPSLHLSFSAYKTKI